ncbi:hypothetical protein GCM10027050_19450 [Psychrosphaera aestuarii]
MKQRFICKQTEAIRSPGILAALFVGFFWLGGVVKPSSKNSVSHAPISKRWPKSYMLTLNNRSKLFVQAQ